MLGWPSHLRGFMRLPLSLVVARLCIQVVTDEVILVPPNPFFLFFVFVCFFDIDNLTQLLSTTLSITESSLVFFPCFGIF